MLLQVVRIDDIARSAVITNEIVRLLQNADLCVIVLTGENANVFYEAGRRHVTGKPFIQLIRRGEKIPFDVAGIRAILYDDPSTLESATKLTSAIRKFVDELERTGYTPIGTGESFPLSQQRLTESNPSYPKCIQVRQHFRCLNQRLTTLESMPSGIRERFLWRQ